MHEGLDLLTAAAAILFGYLAGSIPFGTSVNPQRYNPSAMCCGV